MLSRRAGANGQERPGLKTFRFLVKIITPGSTPTGMLFAPAPALNGPRELLRKLLGRSSVGAALSGPRGGD